MQGDSALFDYLASTPIGTMFSVEGIGRDSAHPLFSTLEKALEEVDDKLVVEHLASAHFVGMYGRLSKAAQERQARIDIVVSQAAQQICATRLELLIQKDPRPAPYSHPAISDLELSSDLLVPLSPFDIDGSVLVRNGQAFTPLVTVESPNAMYWFMSAVSRLGLKEIMSVRLDPLMHGPVSEFPRMGFKMWLYGRPLDLATLTTLTKETFARWIPGPGSSTSSEYTDYVWSPRDQELHLTIEELPKLDSLRTRGSRYLHAIFDRTSSKFIHVDGATRLFTSEQWLSRQAVHLRQAGKVGTRVKVFGVQESITTDVLTSLCAPYFVWNYDIAKFCGMDIHDAFLGSEVAV